MERLATHEGFDQAKKRSKLLAIGDSYSRKNIELRDDVFLRKFAGSSTVKDTVKM